MLSIAGPGWNCWRDKESCAFYTKRGSPGGVSSSVDGAWCTFQGEKRVFSWQQFWPFVKQVGQNLESSVQFFKVNNDGCYLR